jgi:hypothetical protein
MKWIMAMFSRLRRFADRRRAIEEMEHAVTERRIAEGMSKQRLEKVIEVQKRRYNASALAQSLRWERHNDEHD